MISAKDRSGWLECVSFRALYMCECAAVATPRRVGGGDG